MQVKKEKKNVPIEVESDVIAFGDKVIGEAIDMGASDIHIEAFNNCNPNPVLLQSLLYGDKKYGNEFIKIYQDDWGLIYNSFDIDKIWQASLAINLKIC